MNTVLRDYLLMMINTSLCRNLKYAFDQGRIKKYVPPLPQPPPPLSVTPITVTPSDVRQTRSFIRDYNKNASTINDLQGNNKVLNIIIDSLEDELQEVRDKLREYRDDNIAVDEVAVAGVEEQSNTVVVVDEPVAKKPKLSTYTLHHQRLVMKMKTEFKYRKAFHDLKERQKKERIDDIVINIIAACIDSIAMKKKRSVLCW